LLQGKKVKLHWFRVSVWITKLIEAIAAFNIGDANTQPDENEKQKLTSSPDGKKRTHTDSRKRNKIEK